jgi:GNAT superfamily N-acetyltransferase
MDARKGNEMNGTPALRFRPLTPARWDDFKDLFGERGACAGCWCMWWRLKRADFEKGQGSLNRRRMKNLVNSGEQPGILAYRGRKAVGWCSVAPREKYDTLARSRVLKPLDDEKVWSIVCLFVDKEHRGEGIAEALIEEAVRFARGTKARMIEAYPTVPRKGKLPAISSFMGTPEMFFRAGFAEAARPSEARMIVRRRIR